MFISVRWYPDTTSQFWPRAFAETTDPIDPVWSYAAPFAYFFLHSVSQNSLQKNMIKTQNRIQKMWSVINVFRNLYELLLYAKQIKPG